MNGLSISSASQGLSASTRRFDRSASAVSSAATQLSSAASSSGSGPDIIDGRVGLQVAASDVKVHIAVVRTADELLGTLLDMHA